MIEKWRPCFQSMTHRTAIHLGQEFRDKPHPLLIVQKLGHEVSRRRQGNTSLCEFQGTQALPEHMASLVIWQAVVYTRNCAKSARDEVEKMFRTAELPYPMNQRPS